MVGSICAYHLIVPETSYESDEPWIGRATRGMALLPPREQVAQESAESVRVRITHLSPNPGVLYSCVDVTPVEPTSEVWPLHFHVDRRMTTRLCAGDIVHLRTTHCGGFAISILRNGELLAAAGAICQVPLGNHVIARVPAELLDEAMAVIWRRHPDFHWHESPVEVSINGECDLLLRARTSIGGYDVFMVHGPTWGIPGTDECLAISRIGSGLEVSANTTALLLKAPIGAGGLNGLLGYEDRVRMLTDSSQERWWSEHMAAVRGRPANP